RRIVNCLIHFSQIYAQHNSPPKQQIFFLQSDYHNYKQICRNCLSANLLPIANVSYSLCTSFPFFIFLNASRIRTELITCSKKSINSSEVTYSNLSVRNSPKCIRPFFSSTNEGIFFLTYSSTSCTFAPPLRPTLIFPLWFIKQRTPSLV